MIDEMADSMNIALDFIPSGNQQIWEQDRAQLAKRIQAICARVRAEEEERSQFLLEDIRYTAKRPLLIGHHCDYRVQLEAIEQKTGAFLKAYRADKAKVAQ